MTVTDAAHEAIREGDEGRRPVPNHIYTPFIPVTPPRTYYRGRGARPTRVDGVGAGAPGVLACSSTSGTVITHTHTHTIHGQSVHRVASMTKSIELETHSLVWSGGMMGPRSMQVFTPQGPLVSRISLVLPVALSQQIQRSALSQVIIFPMSRAQPLKSRADNVHTFNGTGGHLFSVSIYFFGQNPALVNRASRA